MNILLLTIAPASFFLAGLTNGISLLLPWVVYGVWIYKMQKEFDTDLDL